MKRSWAIILAAIALGGCRSSQQPTNPFLRTTVPPPGTGEAAVVVPGEPYSPTGTPTPSPVVPQATAPVAPVTPAPAAAQPVVPPPRERNKPVPGGDLFYHQSSVDRSGAAAPTEVAQLPGDASDGVPEAPAAAVNTAAPDLLALGGPSDAVAQAVALSRQPAPADAANFADYGGDLPGETTTTDDSSQRASAPAMMPEPRPSGDSELGALGSNLHGADEATAASPDPDWSSSAERTERTGAA